MHASPQGGTASLGGVDFEGEPVGTGGSGGGSGGAGGTTSSSSSSSSGGGDGGAMVCSPGTTKPCYVGTAGTEGKGICVGGTATCDPDGSKWGACVGQGVPKAETCGATEDEDCDGLECVMWAIGLAGGHVSSAAPSADGAFIVAGSTVAPTTLGQVALPVGGFIAKLKVDGTAAWAIQGSRVKTRPLPSRSYGMQQKVVAPLGAAVPVG